MSRMTRLVLAAVFVELIAVAIIVPATRWDAISVNLSAAAGARRLDTVRLIITFVPPLVLALSAALTARRLKSSAPRLSSPHRGYAEAGILVAAFFLMAYQGWFAAHLGEGQVAHASRDFMLRAGAIFAGMVMEVQGNFTAKAPSPSGLRAPDPATWTRVKSRSGWIMSLTGVVIAVSAISLPLQLLLEVFMLLGASAIAYVVIQNLRLRAASGA